MPRHPNHKAHLIGLALVDEFRSSGRPLQSDDLCPRGCAPDAFGLILAAAPAAVPVSLAFSGVAYLRKLAAHRRRVRRDLARLAGPVGPPAPRKPRRSPLPHGRRWDSLRTCRCAFPGCYRWLLGESEEPLRAAAVRGRMPCVRHLPPPVAARVHGRPLCPDCSALVRRTA